MSRTALRAAVSAAALALLARAATAGPPAMVSVGMGASDLTSDGMTAVGSIYDAGLNEHIVYQYSRGVGAFRTEGIIDAGSVRCSNDAGAMSWGANDLENLCGFGSNRSNAHRWSWADSLVNMGCAPNGFNCDFNVNTPNDISGNGAFIVGGGWTASLCGPYRAWRYSVATQTYTQLPISVSGAPLFAPASATRADSVSNDGSVIIGYDQNYNATFTAQIRRASAWVWNGSAWVEAILDSNGGAAYAVNSTGTACTGTVAAATGNPLNVQKWTRSGTTWTRSDKGRPADRGLQSSGGDGPVFRTYPGAISDDGNTIIGYCEYLDDGYPISQARRRPFIWRPTLNGGVPIDLDDYLQSLPDSNPTFIDTTITSASALSSDASAILVGYGDLRHADCLFTGGAGILYLDGTTCEAPGINFSPVSHYEPNFPSGYFIFNVFATGSWPLTYQWQKETDTGTDVWVDLTDDNCGSFATEDYDIKGSAGPQLRLGNYSGTWSGRYRCVVTNSCGSAVSGIARAATCFADFDCNTFVNGDDFDSFAYHFFYGLPEADIDGNTFVNGDDFDAFASAFYVGC